MSGTAPLLEIEDLRVHYETARGPVKAADGVSFTVHRGERLGTEPAAQIDSGG